jgi:hypothetical protein
MNPSPSPHRRELPVPSPYCAALEALRWIGDPAVVARPDEPGGRYRHTVAMLARAEAHHILRAGALLREAAVLAGAPDAADDIEAGTVEAVRRTATRRPCTAPAPIASAVRIALPAGSLDRHAAVLIWYHALIGWGARTP